MTGVITAKGHRDKGLSLDELTFADALSKAGYATALYGMQRARLSSALLLS